MAITIPGSSATSAVVSRTWKDGSTGYKIRIRNDILYTDKLLPGGNWGQAEGVGWEVVDSVQ